MSEKQPGRPRVRKRKRPRPQNVEGDSFAGASNDAESDFGAGATRQGEGTDACRVGYRKPPRQTQFKKGKSGNPRGRPKGRKNTRTIVEETLYTPITVRENGREKCIPALHAILVQFRNKAVSGDHRAMDKILKLLPYLDESERTAEESNADAPSFDPKQDRALLDEFAQMIREAESVTSKEDANDEQ